MTLGIATTQTAFMSQQKPHTTDLQAHGAFPPEAWGSLRLLFPRSTQSGSRPKGRKSRPSLILARHTPGLVQCYEIQAERLRRRWPAPQSGQSGPTWDSQRAPRPCWLRIHRQVQAKRMVKQCRRNSESAGAKSSLVFYRASKARTHITYTRLVSLSLSLHHTTHTSAALR